MGKAAGLPSILQSNKRRHSITKILQKKCEKIRDFLFMFVEISQRFMAVDGKSRGNSYGAHCSSDILSMFTACVKP